MLHALTAIYLAIERRDWRDLTRVRPVHDLEV